MSKNGSRVKTQPAAGRTFNSLVVFRAFGLQSLDRFEAWLWKQRRGERAKSAFQVPGI